MKTHATQANRSSVLRILLLSAALTITINQSAQAGSLYWDTSALTGLNAGNGTWGTDSFWATSNNPGTTAPGAWTNGSDAFFQTAGTNVVSINATGVSASSLTQTTGSTVTTISSGGGTLTINGNGTAAIVNSGNQLLTINSTLTLGNGTARTYTINATSGANIAIGGAIGQNGTAGISKTGAGTLTLSNTNTFNGTTTVNAGTLALDFSQATAPTTNIINSSSALTLAGGNLTLTQKASTQNSQQFASTTFGAGASAITLTGATGNTIALNLQGITRNVGATVNFTQPAGTLSANNSIQTSTGTASTILTDSGAAYATVGGNDWAAKDSTNGWIVGLSTIGGGYTAANATSLAGNADISTAVNPTLSANTTITSLRFSNAGARTVTATGYTLTTGGILVSSSVGASTGSTITGGTLMGASGKDLAVINNNNYWLTIGSQIVDNGSATGFTKSGSGDVILTGNNTYTGATTINSGYLYINGAGQLGGGSYAGAININSNSILAFQSSAGQTLTGITSGTGTFEVGHNATGTVTLSTGGQIQNTGGGIIVGNQNGGVGTLNISGNGSIQNTGAGIILGYNAGSSGTLNISGNGSIVNTGQTNNCGISVGGANNGNGTLNISGNASVSNINYSTAIGNGASAVGTVNMTGGTLNVQNLQIGYNGVGYFNQSGGTVQGNGYRWRVAENSTSAIGFYTLTGGLANQSFDMHVGFSGTGALYISGNSTFNSNSGFGIAENTPTSYGVVDVAGGSLYMSYSGRNFVVGGNGTGVLNVRGGNVTASNGATGGLQLGGTATAVGEVNLMSGTLSVSGVSGSNGTTSFNFNGGTLQASSTSNATFMNGLTSATVYSGGAKIDTQASNITIGQTLLAASGNGVATIPVSAGGSGYQAAPVVKITGGNGTGATAVANVSGGVITGFTITNPGTGYDGSPLTITLVGGNATTAATLGNTTWAANTSGGLAKSGTGNLTLSAANTFSGTTTISAGKIVLGNASALQNSALDTTGANATIGLDVTGYTTPTLGGLVGSVNLATGITGYGNVTTLTLNPQAGSSVTYSGVIANGGMTLTKTGAGTQVLTNASNTYGGGTTINNGVLSFANGALGTTGAITVNGGTLQWNGNNTQDISSRLTLQNSGAATLDTNSNNVTLANGFGGSTSSSLTKAGAGNLTLTGNNSYTGTTTVSNGTLAIGAGGVVGGASNAFTVAGGTLAVSGGSVTAASANLAIGTAAGAGSVNISSGTFTSSGNSTVSIGNGGTANWTQTGGNATFNGGVYFGSSSPAQMTISGGTFTQTAGSLYLGTFGGSSGTMTISGSGSVDLQWLIFGFNNTAGTNTANLNGGTLQTTNLFVNGSSGNSTLNFNGGTYKAGANITSPTNLNTVVQSGGAVIDTNGNALTIPTALTNGGGGGGLTKQGNGTLTLSGNNTYTGATTVTTGTLVLNGYNNGTSGIAVQPNATLNGYGKTTGAISGAGLVGPGNSPGILTASQVDPGSGLKFAFEYTATGSPIFGNATSSNNDVLHLNNPTTPFTASLSSGAGNTVSFYLNVASITNGDSFLGGFFTDKSADFLSSINGATLVYYVKGDGGGSNAYNGFNYYTLAQYNAHVAQTLSINLSTTQVASAAFADGTVNGGYISELNVVPEPATWALLAFSLTTVVVLRRRRRD